MSYAKTDKTSSIFDVIFASIERIAEQRYRDVRFFSILCAVNAIATIGNLFLLSVLEKQIQHQKTLQEPAIVQPVSPVTRFVSDDPQCISGVPLFVADFDSPVASYSQRWFCNNRDLVFPLTTCSQLNRVFAIHLACPQLPRQCLLVAHNGLAESPIRFLEFVCRPLLDAIGDLYGTINFFPLNQNDKTTDTKTYAETPKRSGCEYVQWTICRSTPCAQGKDGNVNAGICRQNWSAEKYASTLGNWHESASNRNFASYFGISWRNNAEFNAERIEFGQISENFRKIFFAKTLEDIESAGKLREIFKNFPKSFRYPIDITHRTGYNSGITNGAFHPIYNKRLAKVLKHFNKPDNNLNASKIVAIRKYTLLWDSFNSLTYTTAQTLAQKGRAS